MSPSAQLKALRHRTPDSIAPDGQPLMFIAAGSLPKPRQANTTKQYGTQATGGVS